jgi:hypothetical protein
LGEIHRQSSLLEMLSNPAVFGPPAAVDLPGGSATYIRRNIHKNAIDSHRFRQQRKATMPMLFWLPTIFGGAFFELARITCERW